MFIRPILALTLLGVAFQAGAAERSDVNKIIPGDVHGDRQDQPSETTREQRARSGETTRDQQVQGRSDSVRNRQGMDGKAQEQGEGTWISISGTAKQANAEGFTLDYGNGEIKVSLENMDWYNDAVHKQLNDSKVTVRGEMNNGLFQSSTLKASSVYAESLGSYFQANNSDHQDAVFSSYTGVAVEEGHVTLRGKVASVNGDGDSFTIRTGESEMTINVSDLDNNPLDHEGYQKLEVGDQVSVNGALKGKLAADTELNATKVVSLSSAKNQAGQPSQRGQQDRQNQRGQQGADQDRQNQRGQQGADQDRLNQRRQPGQTNPTE